MEAVQKTPEREAFYKKIDGENLSALWNVMGDLITPEPRSACWPHLWKFDAIRDYMTEAGELITAKEVTRRVLVLENPGLRGQSKVTRVKFSNSPTRTGMTGSLLTSTACLRAGAEATRLGSGTAPLKFFGTRSTAVRLPCVDICRSNGSRSAKR